MSQWMLRAGISMYRYEKRQLSPLIYQGDSRLKAFVYETLLRADETGKLIPGLAESWQEEREGLRFTLQLRKGMKFHDGSACNAAAVVAHFQRWVGQDLHRWVGSTSKIEKVQALDPLRLQIDLKEPYPVLHDLCLINPCSIPAPSTFEEKAQNTILGTGPFRVIDFNPAERALFGRYEDYAGCEIKPAFFEMRFYEKTNARNRDLVQALSRGEVDLIADSWFPEIPRDQALALAQDEKFKLLETPGFSVLFLGFNHNRPPFSERSVRARVAKALDRKALIQSAESGLADPVETLFSPRIATWPKSATPVEPPSPLPADSDGGSMRIGLLVVENDSAQIAAAQKILEQLAALGLDVLIEPCSYSTLAQRRSKGDYHCFLANTWGVPYDPHANLFANFTHSPTANSIKEGPPYYAHRALTPLIEASWKAKDDRERAALYAKIQAHLDQEVAVVPLYAFRRLALLRKEVGGFRFTPTGYDFDFSTLSLIENDEEK